MPVARRTILELLKHRIAPFRSGVSTAKSCSGGSLWHSVKLAFNIAWASDSLGFCFCML